MGGFGFGALGAVLGAGLGGIGPGWDALNVGVYQNGDSGHHEGDAEPLAHVEGHAVLELNLRFLDELYDEPSAEAADKEPSEVEAAVGLV